MSWGLLSIGEITKVVTKGTTPKVFTDSGVNYIKAQALNGDSSLDSDSFFSISEDTHGALKRSQLEEKDVLLTIAGAQIGKCGYVKRHHLPANTNQAVGIMRPDRTKVNPLFLYYFFKQERTFRFVQGLNAQAAQPNINLTMLKNIKLPFSPLDTQNKIASILSNYDDLIDNNNRRIELLEESARLLYREWFIKLKFPGHENTKIIDGVPEGWEKKKLKDVAKINLESLKVGHHGLIEYVDIASVSPNSIDSSQIIEFEKAPSRARRIVKHGDIIWSGSVQYSVSPFLIPSLPPQPAEVKVSSENGPPNSHVGGIDFLLERVFGTIVSSYK